MTTNKIHLEPAKRSSGWRRRAVGRTASIEDRDQGPIELKPDRIRIESRMSNRLALAGPAGAGVEDRSPRLPASHLSYVYDPRFDQPDAEARFREPVLDGPPRESGSPTPPAGVSPYLAGLYRASKPLRPGEETSLFLRMNYLKYRACKLLESLNPRSISASGLDTIERLQEEARAIKDQIVRANLRLVVSIARRRVGQDRNFFEVVSEANLTLILAVEKFDVSRGFKFSTYATSAIVKNLIRTTAREIHQLSRFKTGLPELFGSAIDHRTEERECEAERDRRRNQEVVRSVLGRLNARERAIIVSRFGLEGAREKTLHQLGMELGITRERVRQIESQARKKLREHALEESLNLAAPR